MTLPVKLAVFDCDGTIVDSQHSIMACMAAAFSDNGLQPPGIAEVRRVVGLPLAQAIEVIAPEGAPISAMAEAYSRHWSEARAQNALSEPLFPGILKVFEDLMSSGWLLGVATGKSMRGLEATLGHHNIASKFVTLQTADRARGKPHPEMLEFAMLETGAKPHETVMIGDTTFDMEMARSAGVRAVGVSWGYHAPVELLRSGAHVIAENMAELAQLCEYEEEVAS